MEYDVTVSSIGNVCYDKKIIESKPELRCSFIYSLRMVVSITVTEISIKPVKISVRGHLRMFLRIPLS